MALIRTLTISTTTFERMKEKFYGFRQTGKNSLVAKYFFGRFVALPCEKLIFAFERSYSTYAVRKSMLDMPVAGSF